MFHTLQYGLLFLICSRLLMFFKTFDENHLHISSLFNIFCAVEVRLQHPPACGCILCMCMCYGFCICSEIVEGWPGGLYRLRDRGANPVKATVPKLATRQIEVLNMLNMLNYVMGLCIYVFICLSLLSLLIYLSILSSNFHLEISWDIPEAWDLVCSGGAGCLLCSQRCTWNGSQFDRSSLGSRRILWW